MTADRIHSWDRWRGGAKDRLLLVCAPLLLAGWLALSCWCVVSLSALAGLAAPAAPVAARASGQDSGAVVVWIGSEQRPPADRR